MQREWAVPEEDFKLLFYYLRRIDDLLEHSRLRDEDMINIKAILGRARLRDPKFKNEEG